MRLDTHVPTRSFNGSGPTSRTIILHKMFAYWNLIYHGPPFFIHNKVITVDGLPYQTAPMDRNQLFYSPSFLICSAYTIPCNSISTSSFSPKSLRHFFALL